ncbi:hypothetical protein JYU34_001151 [Plutella xylostella]|uniref:Uncharacterized protein n=1 Tax=Plutella xylostella TaxID=51655 RepID=A0ABQ7R641_PLUXY|nr:hypothetical protein JYU34_001151 [Plutella xylostella]
MKTNSSVSILPKKCRSRTKGSRCYTLPRKQEERIKTGLRYNNPAAMVVWAITRIPASEKGVTGRRLINFMKRHYEATNDPGGTGKSLGALLRYAVTFGLLAKRGNKYFLAVKYT